MSDSPLPAYAVYLTEDIDSLPNISFNSNIDNLEMCASIIQTAIIERCDPARLANPKTRVDELFSQYTKLKNSELFSSHFAIFERISGELSMGLSKSFKTLRDQVYKEVMELDEIISHQEEVAEATAGDGMLSDDDTVPEQEMMLMDWQHYNLLLGGKEYIVDFHKRHYNRASESFGDILYVINHNNMAIESLKDVSYDDLKLELTRVINKKFGENDTDVFNMREILTLATDPYEFNRHITGLRHICGHQDIGEYISPVCSFIEGCAALMPAAERLTFNLSSTNRDIMKRNIAKVRELMMLEGYALLAARKNYRNAVLINGTLVNGDTIDDFNEAGGSLTDAYNHVRHFHFADGRTQVLPPTGIEGKFILESKQRYLADKAELDERMKKKRAATKLRDKANITRDAMNEYIINLPDERIPTGMSLTEFRRINSNLADSLSHRIDLNPDCNRQNLLFDFILKSQYFGTPLARLHERMGELVVATIKSHNGDANIVDFNDKSRDEIRGAVSSEFATNFVVSKLLS